MADFEIKARDAAARLGQFTLPHGRITTPALLPVINPHKQVISPSEMKSVFGTEIVITNSYIILKDAVLRQQAVEQGLHTLLDFSGPIMTDSGTFQSYVYGDVAVEPLEIIEFQRAIGSDVGTILDIFSTPKDTKIQARKGVEETIQRAKIGVKHKGAMSLALPVQGGIYPKLRKHCAIKLCELNGDVFPIGGVVPLMETQRFTDLVKVIIASKQGLNPAYPVHLFGAGHPLIFPLAVALGCDLFDSSSYVKFAIDQRLLFPWGTEHLQNLTELPCSCPICSSITAKELQDETLSQQIKHIAHHNLYICQAEIRRIRTAIKQGDLWKLVEQRASQNPHLYDALQLLKKKQKNEWLQQQESSTKTSAIRYSGSFTLYQPLLVRLRNRLLTRYIPSSKELVVLPEGRTPYATTYHDRLKVLFDSKPEVTIIVKTLMGPVPIELDEMYPFAQSNLPTHIDRETRQLLNKYFHQFISHHGLKEIPESFMKNSVKKTNNFSQLILEKRVKSVSNMQFGNIAGSIFFSKPIDVLVSKKTGKIRRVFSDEKHILSMRAQDGLFTLKIAGAKQLHKHIIKPNLRVVVDDEAVPFVEEGKSVFNKFVVSCDPELRPYDECILVDLKDRFIGVGRCLLTGHEMEAFSVGVAVKTRESIKK